MAYGLDWSELYMAQGAIRAEFETLLRHEKWKEAYALSLESAAIGRDLAEWIREKMEREGKRLREAD